MTTKKIIFYAIGLFLIFALAYVGVNKYINPNGMFSEENLDVIDGIESEEVQVSEEDRIQAKSTYYPFEENNIIG